MPMTDVPLLVEPARHLLRPGTTVEELGDTVSSRHTPTMKRWAAAA